jgi:hypothetical protein
MTCARFEYWLLTRDVERDFVFAFSAYFDIEPIFLFVSSFTTSNPATIFIPDSHLQTKLHEPQRSHGSFNRKACLMLFLSFNFVQRPRG